MKSILIFAMFGNTLTSGLRVQPSAYAIASPSVLVGSSVSTVYTIDLLLPFPSPKVLTFPSAAITTSLDEALVPTTTSLIISPTSKNPPPDGVTTIETHIKREQKSAMIEILALSSTTLASGGPILSGSTTTTITTTTTSSVTYIGTTISTTTAVATSGLINPNENSTSPTKPNSAVSSSGKGGFTRIIDLVSIFMEAKSRLLMAKFWCQLLFVVLIFVA
jgi:hypothetical protein